MKIEPKYILFAASLMLYLLKRIFSKKPFVIKYNNHIMLIVFLLLLAILILEFWKTKNYIIFAVIGMGLVAIIKVFYDMNKADKDEKQ